VLVIGHKPSNASQTLIPKGVDEKLLSFSSVGRVHTQPVLPLIIENTGTGRGAALADRLLVRELARFFAVETGALRGKPVTTRAFLTTEHVAEHEPTDDWTRDPSLGDSTNAGLRTPRGGSADDGGAVYRRRREPRNRSGNAGQQPGTARSAARPELQG
jgi:hypothetical protein